MGVDLPMGWYQVAWAGEFTAGTVRPVLAFGDDYVLYQGEGGEFRFLEGHCAHMGAHLGYGGRVQGDCIVCPYHGWRWRGSGEVDDIPYSSRLNRGRRLVSRQVEVVSGLVFVWFHPAAEPPLWPVPMPAVAEHEDPGFYPIWPHAVRAEEMTGHPQYVVENQVDAAHFVHVHKWSEYPQIDEYGAEGHCFTSMTRAKLATKRGTVAQNVQVKAWGPGVVVARHGFDFGARDSGQPRSDEVTIICTTPAGPGRAVLRMTAWIPREPGDDADRPTGRAAAMLKAAHREVYERDWQIWNHLRYSARPAYAREEARAFSEVRKWLAQYYVPCAVTR